MTRHLQTLFAVFLCIGCSELLAQQSAYTFPSQPYQPIPASTVPINAPTVLPDSYPPQTADYPVLPLPPPMASTSATHSLSASSAADIGTLIPLSLPGYELRVMDVTKRITFDVNGSPVAAEVPIFVYLPKSTQSLSDSTRELRKVYNDLIMLYDQEKVDKERVRAMLKRMDGIIDTYDAITPSVGRHSSPANTY